MSAYSQFKAGFGPAFHYGSSLAIPWQAKAALWVANEAYQWNKSRKKQIPKPSFRKKHEKKGRFNKRNKKKNKKY